MSCSFASGSPTGLISLALLLSELRRVAPGPAADRGLRPRPQLGRDHDRLHDDGRRPEHRRRLRGPARPRLRRLLRCRRVHGRLVRLAAVRPVDVPLRLGRDQQGRARHPSLDLARPAAGGPLHDDRRHPDRPADPAAARRLPRDRDARLRRDRPAVRPQRRQRLRLRPHARHLRDQPDRLARLRQRRRVARPAAQLPAVVRPRAMVLLDRARAAPDHRLLLAFGCATPGSAAPGSRSARTRRRRPRWACR